MQLKKLMENWRKTLKEEQWDPADIVGALAEDFGYTLHTAPRWMSALADSGKYVIIFNAFSENECLLNPKCPDILATYKDEARQKTEELNTMFTKFISLAQEELGVPLPDHGGILGLTDWVKLENPHMNSAHAIPPNAEKHYWDETIEALVIPWDKEMLTKIMMEYSFASSLVSGKENSWNDFLYEFKPVQTRLSDLRYGKIVSKKEHFAALEREHRKGLDRIYRHIKRKAYEAANNDN